MGKTVLAISSNFINYVSYPELTPEIVVKRLCS